MPEATASKGRKYARQLLMISQPVVECASSLLGLPQQSILAVNKVTSSTYTLLFQVVNRVHA